MGNYIGFLDVSGAPITAAIDAVVVASAAAPSAMDGLFP